MENRRKKEESQDTISPAIRAAAEAATKRKTAGKKGKPKEYGYVTMRIEKDRYEQLQELFGAKGLAMATATQMSLMYIAEMIDSGAMTISRGGIIDIRRR